MDILNSNMVEYSNTITNKSLIDLTKDIFNKPERPTIHTLRVGSYIISGTDYAQVVKKFIKVCKEEFINEEK
jgi:hypothetical protein